MNPFDNALHEIVTTKTAGNLSPAMQRALLALFLGEKDVHNGKTWWALMERGLIRNSAWPNYRSSNDFLTPDGMSVAIALCDPNPSVAWVAFREPIMSESRLRNLAWLHSRDRRTA